LRASFEVAAPRHTGYQASFRAFPLPVERLQLKFSAEFDSGASLAHRGMVKRTARVLQ